MIRNIENNKTLYRDLILVLETTNNYALETTNNYALNDKTSYGDP